MDSSLIWKTNWLPSVLWHCWFGHMTCKNRSRYDLECVWWDVKPCSVSQSVHQHVCAYISCQKYTADDFHTVCFDWLRRNIQRLQSEISWMKVRVTDCWTVDSYIGMVCGSASNAVDYISWKAAVAKRQPSPIRPIMCLVWRLNLAQSVTKWRNLTKEESMS